MNSFQVYLSGESASVQLIRKLLDRLNPNVRLWNTYGPSETTIDCTYHLIDLSADQKHIPIGQPLPNYRCLILDQFLQPVILGQVGELFVGGVGVFAGYLHRDDLTTEVLISIDDHIFYRTGDLVRQDNNGLLYYMGRKDHQVKLRGQRIELGEIEECILNASSDIATCVVTKWENEYLVAYVQSSRASEKVIREYCEAHLPVFMVPSIFVVLEQLPLNSNGKVDRKRLSSLHISTSRKTESVTRNLPANIVEARVHALWCEILKLNGDQLSTTESFFSMGGHSLLLIQMYYRYQSSFSFDNQLLTIAPFLRQTTIVEHAKILALCQSIDIIPSEVWQPLLINEGNVGASFL